MSVTHGQVNFVKLLLLVNGVNIKVHISSSKRLGSVTFFQDQTFSGHLWGPRCNFSSVTSTRSSEVTRGLLCVCVCVCACFFYNSIAVARMKIEAWNKHQCVCLVHAHRLIRNMTYFGHVMTFGDRDLTSNFQVDLLRSCIPHSNRLDEMNTMVVGLSLYLD